MATRRMRIKATINVPRGGIKQEPPEAPTSSQETAQAAPILSQALVSSPVRPSTPAGQEPGPASPLRTCTTPPVSIPSSPSHSSTAIPWLQRPSPSKSPAGLPPSGSVIRRSPSPALSYHHDSPGPLQVQHYSPLSPVKSPGPPAPPHSPVKYLSKTPVVVIPTSSITLSGGGILRSNVVEPPHSPITSPGPPAVFRPPPSPSPSRPSPAQSPVSRVVPSSSTFLTHHFNSNSNSADSFEVAALMSGAGGAVTPQSPEKRSSSTSSSRGPGAFSSVSSNVNPSPSFAKTVFDNPESLKKRSEDIRKKEAQPNPTRFAAARKEFFDKLQSGQVPERGKMTMLHFTFYNPPNPENVTKLSLSKRMARSRAASMCSDASSVVTKVEKEDDENGAVGAAAATGKANSAPSSIAGSRRTTSSSVVSAAGSEGGHSDAGSVGSSGSAPGPRVKVGPDGRLIIDEKSIVVETSESQRAQKQIEEMEVVSGAEYAVGSSGFYRYKKNYRRGGDWSERETIRFYRALNQCGTDFSMMVCLFPNRTRQELKAKFKREDRKNPDMISKALVSCVFDPDEGISSDEEKDKLLYEEKEAEEVICEALTTTQGKKKRTSKKKKEELQLTAEQKEEVDMLKATIRGKGKGKGRAWNVPVEGLEQGGKLPPPPPPYFQPIQPAHLTEIKEEVEEKPKKKRTRKKKETNNAVGLLTNPGSAPGTVSIVISTGVMNSVPVPPKPITENTATLTVVKEENEEEPPKLPVKNTTPSKPDGEASKRRSRLPKKPNLKKGAAAKQNEDSSQSSSAGVATTGVVELIAPPPPLLPREVEVTGNEEGSEGVVTVDLDELKRIQSETSASALPTSSQQQQKPKPASQRKPKAPPKKRRKKASVSEEGDVQVQKMIVRDPYAKDVFATSTSGSAGEEDGPSACKRVKVLPFRVPGPGGPVPSTCGVSLADELEIEIEMDPTSSES